MPGSAKSDVKLGFWIALGFFLFGLVMAVAQYMLLKLRGQE
jgi:hypothetical protein